MKIPAFRVELAEEAKDRTLASIPEWTLAECYYDGITLMRFRVGDFACGANRKGGHVVRHGKAMDYTVEKIIGRIVCD